MKMLKQCSSHNKNTVFVINHAGHKVLGVVQFLFKSFSFKNIRKKDPIL